MEDYFPFGGPVTGKLLLGQSSAVKEFTDAALNGKHIAIFDGPHSGKSSLILEAIATLKKINPALKTDFVSFDRVRTVEDAVSLVSGILSDSAQTADSLRRIVVLEEFQVLASLDSASSILSVFHGVFSNFTGCLWVVTGSMINAMEKLLSPRGLFGGLLTRVRLVPVAVKDATDYVFHTFNRVGKVISKDDASACCSKLGCSMWYINHLMSIADSMTRGYVTSKILDDAFRTLIYIHSPRFRAAMDSLTWLQINLLQAISDGHTHLTSAEVISTYGLNSSANTIRLRDALQKKELIAFSESDEPFVIDPLFAWWLRTCYF